MFKRQKATLLFLSLILIVTSFFAGFSLRNAKAENSEMADFELFWEVVSLLKDEYVQKIPNPKDLIYGAIRGMLSTLGDDYTRFMEPVVYEEMRIETSGEFGGIGIQIGIKDKKLTVIAPLKGTPAYWAGLKGLDWIVQIDGKSTKDMSLQEAVILIRGKKGTKVTLTIISKGSEESKNYTIIRDIIKVGEVEAKMVGKGIGYIRIPLFNVGTSSQLEEALDRLGNLKMEGLILDLRYNPGGLLDTAIEVGNQFVAKGDPIVQIEGKRSEHVTIYAEERDRPFSLPLVVLVDEASASASEIVAGALQDLKIGVLMGEKTFGKGSVQTVHPLRDGSAVAITSARYLTAKGRDIDKLGIKPDIVVKLTKEEIKKKHDLQLGKAKEWLRKRLARS